MRHRRLDRVFGIRCGSSLKRLDGCVVVAHVWFSETLISLR